MTTLSRQIACIERELAIRVRVFPAWVRSGRIQQSQADDELNAMRAVLETLHSVERETSPALLVWPSRRERAA
jgi:hypothetical protein